MGPSNSSYLSKKYIYIYIAIFHFHDYGIKSIYIELYRYLFLLSNLEGPLAFSINSMNSGQMKLSWICDCSVVGKKQKYSPNGGSIVYNRK